MREKESNDRIVRLKEGDTDVFAEMFRLYHKPVFNYVYRLSGGNTALAEDIMQQVFLNLWQRRGSYDVNRPVVSLLLKIARNAWIDSLKRERYRKHVTLGDIEIEGEVQVQSDTGELEREIKLGLNALEEPYRQVFILSRYHDLKHSEIAEMLGISQKTVEKRMGHALARLKIRLERFLRK